MAMSAVNLPAGTEDSGIAIFDEDYFEWEERAEEVPVSVHMIAGSVAGISEHVLLLPIDSIKTHKQSSLRGLKSKEVVLKLYQETGGVRNFWRGGGIMAVGSVPAHALFFSTYELLNSKLGLVYSASLNIPQHALVGACCSLVHDLSLTPFECLKQHRQLSSAPLEQQLASLLRQGGVLSLWRMFPLTFLLNFPFQSVVIASNECLKRLFFFHRPQTPQTSWQSRPVSFWSHFLCASVSGMLASAVTMPLDVLRTRVNVVSSEVTGWFRGFLPRASVQSAGVACSWSVYGSVKDRLSTLHAHLH